jgi:hypothetical protein
MQTLIYVTNFLIGGLTLVLPVTLYRFGLGNNNAIIVTIFLLIELFLLVRLNYLFRKLNTIK